MIFILGCKKDQLPSYNGNDGISFYTDLNDPDSINYSFALQPTNKSRDTILINMRLVGKLSDKSRSIKLRALNGSTARQDTDYILPVIELPANQFTIKYPLIVLNTPEMKVQTFKLVLGVDPTGQLGTGASGTAIDNSVNHDKKHISITNQLIQPDYWTSISLLFGTFSIVKFQFMIKTTGLINYDANVTGIGALFRIQTQLRNALAVYERLNGPLIDEFGNQVIF